MRCLACLLCAVLVLVGCSRDWERFDVTQSPDAGGAGGTGGTNVGGGTCFPGAKVCLDGSGAPRCVSADLPESGCLGTTQCDPCNLPNASAVCTSGACAIGSCSGDYQDCNDSDADGCESNLLSDAHHCGGCGTDCVALHGAAWVCKEGVCQINECCPSGDAGCLTLRDCDGNKANGCEVDVANDASNCGACGEVCNLPHASPACSQSTCVITQCDTGFANCDGNDFNGCETNIANDVGNCGGCNLTCNSTNGAVQCVNGNCAITCSGSYGNCNNNASDGCEVNLNTDPAHCGKCSTTCNPQHAQAACSAGSCDHGACSGGYSDCDGNKANGCETNTNTDVNNCNACGNKCPIPGSGTAFCANGVCGDNCGALMLCAGNPKYCANTSTDLNNCGSCGNKCPDNTANASPVCSTGSCSFSCNTGYAKCGSTTTCYGINSDPTHCGGSCTVCPGPTSGGGTPTCAAGTCGFTCNGGTPNKCGTKCVSLQTDLTNCGACGVLCTAPPGATAVCAGGSCSFSCNAPLILCSGQCVNTQTDKNHCGSCTTVCSGSQNCVAGSCQ